MGSDISKPEGDDPTKRRGGFFGFGGSQKNGMHNMRILFRGMKGVGKTSLFDVFQGKACPVQYTPSKEINTAHVFWTNPTTKDRVKIEIWDIVDNPSIIENDQVSVERIAEIAKNGGVQSGSYVFDDSSSCSVNIYQGCHACIFIVDPRKLETIEYFKENVANVPTHIPVLLVANFRDQSQDWKITSEDLQKTVDAFSSIPRSGDSSASDSAQSHSLFSDDMRSFGTLVSEFYAGNRRMIHLVESSFLEKFGLHSIYLFLAEPFFILRLAQLRSQVILTLQSLHHADLALTDYVATSTYEAFLEARREYERQMEEQRKKEAEEAAAKAAAKAAKKAGRGRVAESAKKTGVSGVAEAASDSENELATPQPKERLASMEDFYDDAKAEADLKQTIRHMELQRLVMEDALETPLSDDMSPQEVCGRSRQGSVCVNPMEEAVLRSLSERSLVSEDSDASSVVYHKSLRGVMAGVGDGGDEEKDHGDDNQSDKDHGDENQSDKDRGDEKDKEETNDTNKDKDANTDKENDNDNHSTNNTTTPEVPATTNTTATDTSKEEDTQTKTSPPGDETPAIPIDFTEDFTTLFRSRSSQSLERNPTLTSSTETKTDMNDEKKAVSMSARILGVLGRKTEDEKKKKQKKKREGEEAAQEAKEEAPVEETPEMDGGGKKKWEIDQRVMAPMKRMLNSLKPSSSKSHPSGKEEVHTKKEEVHAKKEEVHTKKEETGEVKSEKDGIVSV